MTPSGHDPHDETAQALLESEARTRAILETAVDAIITIDERGTIESLNRAAERLFGYLRVELIGQNVKLLMPSPYREEHDGYLHNYLTTGVKKIIGVGREVLGRRRDGSVFPMHLAVSELWLGRRRMFTGIVRDISDLRRAIQELQDSEARNRAILETAVDAIITIDESGRIELVNPAAERLFGYVAAEIVGQNVNMLMPSPYREEHDGYLQNYLMTGRKRIIGSGREVVGQRKDGSTFPMELAVSEVRLQDRRMFTGIVRDVSERKRSEEQLRYYAAELQDRNRELLRSNQDLDDFAYIASHDLKEPLRGIHNYANFLLEDYGSRFDAAGLAKLETLTRLTVRMDELLDSLLHYSRVGRLDLAICQTDLNELVADVVDSLQIGLQERNVDIRIPRRLPVVRCDRVGVSELYRNLITNAMKYNDKPEKWVELGYAPAPVDADDPGGVALYVRDNGIGIPAKHTASIFRIFKRLHKRDAYGGGTGAGLTIVKKIVERHGGRVWVESTVGAGSAFFFTLGAEIR